MRDNNYTTLSQCAIILSMLYISLLVVMIGSASNIVMAQESVFTSRVDLVHIGVSVVEGDGGPVLELVQDDFQLYEDGEIQEIQYFSRGLASDADVIPTHLGVLFDSSGSMERDGSFAKTAAIKFLNKLRYFSARAEH